MNFTTFNRVLAKITMIQLLCIALSILRVYSETGPSVKTNCGTVIGVYSYSRNDRLYSSFYSVPYAVSPIENLRFEPPQKITNCPDVINATTEGPPCWQPNMLFPDDKNPFIGSEDCLTLSIYTPQVEDCGLLPVMVYFIEGGYTINGAAEGLHGPSYLMDEDIVLVMSNNRLNVFGYLSTEDHVVPGNMALKDQVAVLRYVKENIMKFGGDPDQVTLFGLSSGATTSALHMRSTLSKGLFNRVISQSGTATSQYSLIGVGTPLNFTRRIAASLNCTRNCTRDLVNCLKQIPAVDLVKHHMANLVSQIEMKVELLPVVEERDVPGAFLTKTPLATKFNYPWMTGFSSKDLAYKYGMYINTQLGAEKELKRLDQEFCEKRGTMSLLIDDTSSDPSGQACKIKDYYFKNKAISHTTKNQLIDMYTDIYVACPMIYDITNNLGSTFVYLFDHVGEYKMADTNGIPSNDSIGGASHGDELIYLFTMNNTFPNAELNASDTNISKLMVKLWTNFAKHGMPTIKGISPNPQNSKSKAKVHWTRFGSKREYLHIQTNSVTLETGLLEEQCRFWKTLKLNDKLRANFDKQGFRNH